MVCYSCLVFPEMTVIPMTFDKYRGQTLSACAVCGSGWKISAKTIIKIVKVKEVSIPEPTESTRYKFQLLS